MLYSQSHVRNPLKFLPTYVHVFFGIARGREEDAAVSAGQEAGGTVRFAKGTIVFRIVSAMPAASERLHLCDFP